MRPEAGRTRHRYHVNSNDHSVVDPARFYVKEKVAYTIVKADNPCCCFGLSGKWRGDVGTCRGYSNRHSVFRTSDR
jgi:hypothetical protein